MIINNNTQDTILIILSGQSAYTNGTDSIISLPMNQEIYYKAEGYKIKKKNFECDPQIAFNEVLVKNSSNRILTKDIANKENWDCETDSRNTYLRIVFQINESDLK
jgi:hypothetical protein